jgi:alpha-amylase/alpha-mannosidase (GH57 family)
MKVKYLMDKESMVEARILEVLARKHWSYHRLDEIADWKGGETALAKRLLKKYRMSY